ncbi:unnamed protein product [Pleuronectes platessa]|uniref:Uncharacterized protein n=1 Tax=Pleuronectes platessa TaxID=8262 RepID=A0A9N7YA53_PLEPL|nr:unnamed protein product [Pleuronectes platessa]
MTLMRRSERGEVVKTLEGVEWGGWGWRVRVSAGPLVWGGRGEGGLQGVCCGRERGRGLITFCNRMGFPLEVGDRVDQQTEGESVSRAVNHGQSVARTHKHTTRALRSHSSQADSVWRGGGSLGPEASTGLLSNSRTNDFDSNREEKCIYLYCIVRGCGFNSCGRTVTAGVQVSTQGPTEEEEEEEFKTELVSDHPSLKAPAGRVVSCHTVDCCAHMDSGLLQNPTPPKKGERLDYTFNPLHGHNSPSQSVGSGGRAAPSWSNNAATQSWGVSLQPGGRRCESPLPGPLCSADPVVGVVVQKRREERGAQQLTTPGTRSSFTGAGGTDTRGEKAPGSGSGAVQPEPRQPPCDQLPNEVVSAGMS